MFGPGVRRDSDFNECSVFSLSVFLVVWFVVRFVRVFQFQQFQQQVQRWCSLCLRDVSKFPSPSFQVLQYIC